MNQSITNIDQVRKFAIEVLRKDPNDIDKLIVEVNPSNAEKIVLDDDFRYDGLHPGSVTCYLADEPDVHYDMISFGPEVNTIFGKLPNKSWLVHHSICEQIRQYRSLSPKQRMKKFGHADALI